MPAATFPAATCLVTNRVSLWLASGSAISRPVISNVVGSQSSATTVLVSLDIDEPGVVVCQLHAEGSEPNPSTIESSPSVSYQADIVEDGSAHPVAFTFTYALTTTYDGYQVSCTSRGTSGHLAFAARSEAFPLGTPCCWRA